MPVSIKIIRNRVSEELTITKSLAQGVVRGRIKRLQSKEVKGDSGAVLTALDIAMQRNCETSAFYGPYQFNFSGSIK